MTTNTEPQGRRLTALDRLVAACDRALRTATTTTAEASRPSPAAQLDSEDEPADNTAAIASVRHVAGLMRINHTGEVCAQALYRGQSMTAQSESTRTAMQESAREEEDHLAWCEERLAQLNARPSVLNPAFYAMSFGLGALAGKAGDGISLGFIAATERQVCEHLREHLAQLPEHDVKSRAILEQMIVDEAEHGEKAMAVGGVEFHPGVESVMRLMSKVMTKTTYYI